MGREIKRVPLDFDWPLNKVWQGYLNPFAKARHECLECDGTGYNPETKQIADDWYDHDGFGNRWMYVYGTAPDGTPAKRPPWKIVGDCHRWDNKLEAGEVEALMEHGRLSDLTYPLWYRKDGDQWLVLDERDRDKGWVPCDPPTMPTPEQVNYWSQHSFGHDAINRWICIEARATRLGVWGQCEVCDGTGEHWSSPEAKEQYDTWEKIEPPAGEGWQVWETVSEGSPVSPVFDSPDALIAHLVTDGYSLEAASNFVNSSGWAPSMMAVDGVMYSDIEACGID